MSRLYTVSMFGKRNTSFALPLSPQFRQAQKNDDKFLLTIVTVNQNSAITLQRTLESLRQVRDILEIECIFIDGASTDQSVAIASGFYGPSNIVSEPDAGVYSAMNKGLAMARGKYVLWINSGDELVANIQLDKLLSILRGSTSDIICGVTLMKTEESNEIISAFTPDISKLPRYTLPHPSTFFNRKVILRLGGYDETYKIVGDKDLITRVYLSNGKIEVIDDCIAIFYCGGLSGSKFLYMENELANYRNKVISLFEYLYTVTRVSIHMTKKSLIARAMDIIGRDASRK